MAKFSMTNLTASFVNLCIILCAALSLLFFPRLSLARDLDGKYANAPLKQWFDSLASRRGPCCSVADGQSVEEVDWDMKFGKYRVRLDGQWIEVPPDALVTVPNKFGLAVVCSTRTMKAGRRSGALFLERLGNEFLARTILRNIFLQYGEAWPHGLLAQKVISPGCPTSGYDTGKN